MTWRFSICGEYTVAQADAHRVGATLKSRLINSQRDMSRGIKAVWLSVMSLAECVTRHMSTINGQDDRPVDALRQLCCRLEAELAAAFCNQLIHYVTSCTARSFTLLRHLQATSIMSLSFRVGHLAWIDGLS